jgi:hypothetical protein
MPIKIDGTNGVLQAYDYQVLTTGFSYTFAAGTQTLIINPAGTLATGTITMPASPADGMVITVTTTQQITALTVQGNTGQSIVAGAITMRANQPESFVYRLANTTWYPFAGAANTQVISGTVNAGGTNPFPTSAGPTSVDFTSIPSWVKRITVMFIGVSTSGGSQILVQIGSGSVTNSGYTESSSVASAQTNAVLSVTSTAGCILYSGSASEVTQVNMVLTSVSGNTWLSTHSGARSNWGLVGSAYVTLGGVLDRVRITTVGGTDTFDAGSVNILYE